jgi:hypothetical protein
MIVGVEFALSGLRFCGNQRGSIRLFVSSPVVMAGLDPAIYALAGYGIRLPEGVDQRVKPGDDGFQ